ncbi:MAG: tandem-95 repeat protein [Deltaproteobacteria bacterium]|nr:tandem-95 repeat protein [Deltaproteobacteria bacterium]
MPTPITRVAFGSGQSAQTGHAHYNLVRFAVPPQVPQICVDPPAGLVSWWDGDSVSGTTAFDTQDGNDGTLVNRATTVPGIVGDAFSFDGMDDHVLIGNPANLQLQDFTIDAWIKLNTLAFPTPFDPAILEYGTGGYGFSIARPGGFVTPVSRSPLVLQRFEGGALFLTKVGDTGVNAGLVIRDTEWHHVAVTKGGGTVIFYLDGVGATAPFSYDPGFFFTTNVAIGIRPDINLNSFPGLIDEVELYNRALSAAEIQAIFNAGSAGKCKVANGPPTATDQAVSTDEDTPVAVTLAGSDPDGDALTFSVVSGPAHGALSGAAPNLTYTPDANFNGSDSFTFKANDGTADSNVATVSIAVNPINDPPVAASQSITTPEDTPINVTLSATDPDSGALTFSIVSGPAHGTLASNGALVYTPSPNYNGPDSFTFKANDGAADSNVATVSITVNAVNDAPVAVDDTATTTAGTPVIINVVANDTDVDGDTLSVSAVTQGASGSVAINGDGTLTYTPLSIDALIARVSTLGLNPGVTNSLTSKLEAAKHSLARGQIKAAANQLGAFINELEALKRSGRLDPATADSLLALARAIMNLPASDSFTYTVSDGNGGIDTAAVTVTMTP